MEHATAKRRMKLQKRMLNYLREKGHKTIRRYKRAHSRHKNKHMPRICNEKSSCEQN